MRYYLEPLILTVVTECAMAYLLGERKMKHLYLIVLINCITNPLLVFSSTVLMDLIDLQKGILLTYILLEPCVIFAECLMIRARIKTKIHPLALSLILNVTSVIGGILWRSL